MSWQTPGKEPPPDPAAPEPDAETTRVPLQPAPPETATEPPTETPGTPADQAPARRADLRGSGRLGRPRRAGRGSRRRSGRPLGAARPDGRHPGHGGPGHRRGLQPGRGLRDRHRVPPAPQPGRARPGRRARQRCRSDRDPRGGRPVRRRRLPLLRRPVDQRLARDAGHAPDAVADPGRRERHDAVRQRCAASLDRPDRRGRRSWRSSPASAGTSGWSPPCGSWPCSSPRPPIRSARVSTTGGRARSSSSRHPAAREPRSSAASHWSCCCSWSCRSSWSVSSATSSRTS